MVVLDRAVFLRDKVCAGWITPGVVEALGLDLDDYARANVLQRLAQNRNVLDTFLRYHHEQGLSKRRLAPEDARRSNTLRRLAHMSSAWRRGDAQEELQSGAWLRGKVRCERRIPGLPRGSPR